MGFSFPVRVYWEDTDAGGVVYHAAYLRFTERGRTELLRAMGIEQTVLKHDTGVGFVVRSLEAEFLRPAVLDDQLTVVTEVVAVKGAQMTLAQRIEREGALIFTARVRLACLDLNAMKPVPIPAQIAAQFKALLALESANDRQSFSLSESGKK